MREYDIIAVYLGSHLEEKEVGLYLFYVLPKDSLNVKHITCDVTFYLTNI